MRLGRHAGEVGEGLVGILLWYGSYAWGVVTAAVLLLAPLTLGLVVAALLETSPMVSLVVGTIGSAAMGLPPWTGASWREGGLALCSVILSWLVWQLVREPAAPIVLAACLFLGAAGWAIRRATEMSRRRGVSLGPDA